MEFSLKLSKIKPSATMAMNAKAQELRAQGKKIVSLAVGEPDFNTPDHVKQAAIDAINDNFTRYTPVHGIPTLREAAAKYFKTFYDVDSGPETIIITNGGKQSLYNIFTALLNPGDEVLIPAPYWVSYPDMVLLASGDPVIVPTTQENGFLTSPEELEKYWTPRTRILVLNSPSNPTGCIYPKEKLDAIAAWAVERGILVVSDEIYDQLVYSPAESLSLSPWFAKYPEHFAICNGLAKSFAMTGWRVGFCMAHPDLIKAMNKIQGQQTSNICSIAQKAALAALTGSFDGLAVMREAFERRRDLALSIISSWPGAHCVKPDGAFYLFPDLSAFYKGNITGSADLAKVILEQAEVATVPGIAFGDDRCVRFSYAVADDVLTNALNRVGEVLTRL